MCIFPACLEPWAGSFSGSEPGKENLHFLALLLAFGDKCSGHCHWQFHFRVCFWIATLPFPFLLLKACCFKIFHIRLVFSVSKGLWEGLCKSTISYLNALLLWSLVMDLWCLILCWDRAPAHLLRSVPGYVLPCVLPLSLGSNRRGQKLGLLLHHKWKQAFELGKVTGCPMCFTNLSFPPNSNL